ncbi:MAG: hypothetical protein IPG53_01725 [Ignavibacteriales bacterium]|nr:hypothetical protein [Ignavibacteriales bacterium]
MAGVLSNGGGYYSAAVYIQEARRLGLKILLPCVNKSFYSYMGKGDQLRIGLQAIKNLKRNTAETVIAERKKTGDYTSSKIFW